MGVAVRRSSRVSTSNYSQIPLFFFEDLTPKSCRTSRQSLSREILTLRWIAKLSLLLQAREWSSVVCVPLFASVDQNSHVSSHPLPNTILTILITPGTLNNCSTNFIETPTPFLQLHMRYQNRGDLFLIILRVSGVALPMATELKSRKSRRVVGSHHFPKHYQAGGEQTEPRRN
jgi:hypothetical protein